MNNLGLVADNEDVLLQHDDIRVEIGDKGNILKGDGNFIITSKLSGGLSLHEIAI